MRLFRSLSLALFIMYLAVFPGSTIIVALDRVPWWGDWMGGALLILQGMAALCWMIGFQGWRGALAGALVFLLAWVVEHIGVTTGLPFGRYRYTDMLQPQFFGVPLAIACGWVMVAAGAWQLTANAQTFKRSNVQTFAAATLVLLLDLQIETVATKINRYWVWLDGGPYYGVPTMNFIAWWLVGLAMALIAGKILSTDDGRRHAQDARRKTQDARRKTLHVLRFIPVYLYLLSTLMFIVVNLARGYTIAGLVGVAVLMALALRAVPLCHGRAAAKV